MAWPTVAVVTTGMDADTDALPRSAILDLTTKFNDLIAMRGVANGVCELDGSGLVPNARLDTTLVALASALTAANKIPYATALNVLGELDLSTSTSLGTSNTTLASQLAVKTYVDNQIDVAHTFTKAQRGAVLPLTAGASVAVDLATSNNFSLAMGAAGAYTLAAPSNIVPGQSGIITITQNASPGTLAYNTFWRFAGGTVPSLSGASLIDALAYYVNAAGYATCQFIKNVKVP